MSPIALHDTSALRNDGRPPANTCSPADGLIGLGSDALVRGLPWATLLAAACLGVLDRGFTRTWDTVPFLVSLFLMGMPHGAMDWVVDRRLRRETGLVQGLLGFRWYLAWMVAIAALLYIVPVIAVVGFFVLTVIHWGLGDFDATSPRAGTGFDRVAGIAGRGFLILGTAFAFDPAASWGPFASLIGERTTSPAALSIAQGTGIAALGIGAVLAGFWFARRWRTGDRRGAVMDLVESTLIVTAIALTDPLFGIGVYFLGTHSFRHSVRLAGTSEVMPEGSAGQSLVHRLWTMHLASLPLLVPTFVLVAAWCRLQFGTIDAAGLTVTMLGFFLVTTLPHHLLGLRLPSIRSA